ncbi:hypothetical protein H312_02414, partial [Anncaliia algerae PRA339]
VLIFVYISTKKFSSININSSYNQWRTIKSPIIVLSFPKFRFLYFNNMDYSFYLVRLCFFHAKKCLKTQFMILFGNLITTNIRCFKYTLILCKLNRPKYINSILLLKLNFKFFKIVFFYMDETCIHLEHLNKQPKKGFF